MVLQKNNTKEIKANETTESCHNAALHRPLIIGYPSMSLKGVKLFLRNGTMRNGNGWLDGILVGWLALLPLCYAAESPVETSLTVGLEAPFLDHAVLQQQMPLPVCLSMSR
jgi:hypothetical protein